MGSIQAACIAVLGTGSDVGKSVVTTAFCRILADRGMRVAPFRAQNMSNNSGVTSEGLGLGALPVDAAHGPVVRDKAYDLPAEHTLRHVDMEAIFSLIGAARIGEAP